MNSYLPWYLGMYMHSVVPVYAIVGIVIAVAIGLIVRWRGRYCILMWAYYVFLLCQLVIFRRYADKDCILLPFWNYEDVFLNGNLEDLGEIIINILLFVPIGFLGCLSTQTTNKHPFLKAIVIGVVMSVAIELLQLILHKGLCETDDVIHNTLGVIIGALSSKLLLRSLRG